MRLRAEAAERRELADRVRAALSEQEAEHVVGAHIDDSGTLVLGMDSAAWAARVRYSTQALLGRKIKVRVAVPGGTGKDGAKPE
ncbi:MAG: DciA family protein [Gammaproteobacteria bacterium]